MCCEREKSQKLMKIGIDFGGVIVQHDGKTAHYDAKEDTNFDPDSATK
jgi:hypothetical protein